MLCRSESKLFAKCYQQATNVAASKEIFKVPFRVHWFFTSHSRNGLRSFWGCTVDIVLMNGGFMNHEK